MACLLKKPRPEAEPITFCTRATDLKHSTPSQDQLFNLNPEYSVSATSGLFRGQHVFGELYGIRSDLLNNETLLNQLLREGIALAGATLINIQSHKFFPNGVTSLALLAESHASIHTYPEFGSLFLDVFTCGTVDPTVVFDHIKKNLDPSDFKIETHKRGHVKNV